MKYKLWYEELCRRGMSRRKLPAGERRGGNLYLESHHITPKSLGGSDARWNRTLLTAREHLIAHKLLLRIYPTGAAHGKMARALWTMATVNTEGKRYRLTSREFERLRTKVGEVMSEKMSQPEQQAIRNRGKARNRIERKANGIRLDSWQQKKLSCLKCRRTISAQQRESHYRTCYEGLTSRPGDNPGKVRMSCVVCHEEISIGSSNRHYYAKHPKEHAGINYTRNGLPPPAPTVSCVVCHKSMTKQQYGAHSRRHG